MHLARAIHVDVDLRADPELGQVYARLDGKAGAGQNQALVTRLEVVHVRPVSVQVFGDVMSRAMDECLGIAGLPDDSSGHVVERGAVDRLATLAGAGQFLHDAVTRIADGAPGSP